MTLTCPICKKPTEESEEEFPFCSARCRLLDLGAWSSEKYKVANPAFGEGEPFLPNEDD